MSQPARADDLAQLRALVEGQQRELTRHRAELARLRRRPHLSGLRRWSTTAIAALLVALVPLGLLAAGPFVDLNAGTDHAEANVNIQLIADAGITKGCDPPAYVNYCPNDTVNREQMASFLARTAGLGGNPPIANARTVGGFTPSAMARVAQVDPFGQGTITGYFGANTYQTIATLTIDAPRNGYLLVNGTVTLATTAFCNNYTDCSVTVKLASDNPALQSPLSTAVSNRSGSWYDSVSTMYVFPVQQGTRTVTLQVAKGAQTAPEKVYVNPRLTALFVPFDGTGQPYTSAP